MLGLVLTQRRSAIQKLAIKHDPARHPNDADAPVRWAAVTTAYDKLSDPAKRQWYLSSDYAVPAELTDFDVASLKAGEGRAGA